jgi:hypothetical protein
VGIGTTGPSQKFVVSNAGADNIVMCENSSASIQMFMQATASIGTVGTLTNQALGFLTNNTERARITAGGDLQFNSGYGSVATAYGCRAWVNFDGTGTPAIREDGNVSSITDNGTGDYTVNFTTAMPDANYAVSGIGQAPNGSGTQLITVGTPRLLSGTNYSTSSITVITNEGGTSRVDSLFTCVVVFR